MPFCKTGLSKLSVGRNDLFSDGREKLGSPNIANALPLESHSAAQKPPKFGIN
jgi:hypothetical protein